MGSVRHDIRSEGRKGGRAAGKGNRRPVWRVRFPRSAISRVADAHGTKGGAGDEGGGKGERGERRRKTLRPALKERSPAARRGGIPSRLRRGPGFEARERPITGVFSAFRYTPDSQEGMLIQGTVHLRPILLFHRFYFLSYGSNRESLRVIINENFRTYFDLKVSFSSRCCCLGRV